MVARYCAVGATARFWVGSTCHRGCSTADEGYNLAQKSRLNCSICTANLLAGQKKTRNRPLITSNTCSLPRVKKSDIDKEITWTAEDNNERRDSPQRNDLLKKKIDRTGQTEISPAWSRENNKHPRLQTRLLLQSRTEWQSKWLRFYYAPTIKCGITRADTSQYCRKKSRSKCLTLFCSVLCGHIVQKWRFLGWIQCTVCRGPSGQLIKGTPPCIGVLLESFIVTFTADLWNTTRTSSLLPVVS